MVKQIECEKVTVLCEEQRDNTTLSVVNSMEQMNNKNDCTFRRDGMCDIHGIVGTKFKVTKTVWAELMNGIHGWKSYQVQM